MRILRTCLSRLLAAGLAAAVLPSSALAWSAVENGPATVARKTIQAGAFLADTAASAERRRPSSTGLFFEGRTPRAIGAADLTQTDEPAPPDALEQTGPSRASDSAHAPRTLQICPAGAARPDCRYRSLRDALNAALPGDRVILAPGVYAEGRLIDTPGLELRGEAGAHLRGHAVEGKAALVVKAKGVLIEGIECSGIAVRDNNGACIRIEGDDLTVRNVHFHDNQEGILSGPGGGACWSSTRCSSATALADRRTASTSARQSKPSSSATIGSSRPPVPATA